MIFIIADNSERLAVRDTSVNFGTIHSMLVFTRWLIFFVVKQVLVCFSLVQSMYWDAIVHVKVVNVSIFTDHSFGLIVGLVFITIMTIHSASFLIPTEPFAIFAVDVVDVFQVFLFFI